MSSLSMKPVLLVVGGVILAVSSAVLSTILLPDDNHVIPPPGVGQPLDARVVTQKFNPGEVERGRVYYAQLCLSCHGVRGDGMGEWAYRVTPYPADLRKPRTQGRSDEMLFNIISDGLLATPMIGWKKQLTEAQRWQLVTYIRTLVMHESAQKTINKNLSQSVDSQDIDG